MLSVTGLFRLAALTAVTYNIITLAASKPPFYFNASQYFGSTVISINGEPAHKYMVTWAARAKLGYRTLGQRLNAAFAHFQWYNYRPDVDPGAFSTSRANPNADFINMVLQRYAHPTLGGARVL